MHLLKKKMIGIYRGTLFPVLFSLKVYVTISVLFLHMCSSHKTVPVYLKDSELINDIYDKLKYNETISPHLITIHAYNGVVILYGSVDNIDALSIAEEIVLSTQGVNGFINRIAVDPAFHLDNDIKMHIMHAFENDSTTSKYDLTINVNCGIVSLTGTVKSHAEKALTTSIVRRIKGIRSIKNSITVKHTANNKNFNKTVNTERTQDYIVIDKYFTTLSNINESPTFSMKQDSLFHSDSVRKKGVKRC